MKNSKHILSLSPLIHRFTDSLVHSESENRRIGESVSAIFKVLKFSCFIVLLCLFSCSREKNTIISRNYHNLTSYYNGFFNAKEKVKEGVAQLEKSHQDKYDRPLSVFQYSTAANAKSIYPQMDIAIQKSSFVIQKHSMSIGGKEYCKWIDDNYLLIGKAQFYKYDYYAALETFQYVLTQYKDDPIHFEAMMWLTRTYTELGNQIDAENMIDFIKNDKKFPKKMKAEFSAVAADFNMKIKNYKEAKKYLTQAVVLTKKRLVKARYSFILAQLEQNDGNHEKAVRLYEKVIRINPSYDMTFNAQINRARSIDVSEGNSKEIKKQFMKMIKDEKNKDYLDQLYYALAGLSMREHDEEAAIKYLHLSVRASTINTNQKALSFLELGKIYFKKPDYKAAQTYYDSTVSFLSKDHPDYENILTKKNILTKLIKNLNIIATEDSLQKIAKLNPKERDKMLEKVIAKAVADAEKKKQDSVELKNQQTNAIFNSNTPPPVNNNMTGGGWYFYNPTTISFGYTEFTKKWGNRKLEDNWRRSNKESISHVQGDADNADDTSDKKDTTVASISDKQKYLKNIPLTDKQFEQSNQRIVEAYYNIACIYREELSDNKEAVTNFEELLRRYPENKYQLQCYYQLYRTYNDMDNKEKSDYYKNLLLTKFPDSEYSMLINNPDYFKKNLNAKARLNLFYEETFTAYKKGQCDVVFSRKAMADSLYPANALAPKFAMLKTLCIGQTKDVTTFETSLKTIIKDFPNDSVRFKAQDILNYIATLKNNDAKADTAQTKINQQKSFTLNGDTTQFYIIAFENNKLDANKLKVKLSDFNSKYYSMLPLAIDNTFLNPETQMIAIKEFENKDKAMDYYQGIEKNQDVFKDYPKDSYQQFIISSDNFPRFFQEKDITKYLAFFQENYLK